MSRPLDATRLPRLSALRLKLLGFPVLVMLAAIRAELFHLKTASGRLLVFGACVVPVLALGALERNDFSRHCFTFLAQILLSPKSR
jgi:hypothetical protein